MSYFRLPYHYNYEQISESFLYPYRLFADTSPGKVVFFVNLLMIACFSPIISTSVYVFHFIVGTDLALNNGWLLWASLFIVCTCIVIVCLVGLRGSHLVSLDILINYFWGLIVLAVPLCIAVYGSFNYLSNATLYAEHQWSTEAFDNLREATCDPQSSYLTTCSVPFEGKLNYPHEPPHTTYNATQWCINQYQSTICVGQRDDAFNFALSILRKVLIFNTCMAGLGVMLSCIALYLCYRILTSRVIAQTMNDNINFLLLIPMAGLVMLTTRYWWLMNSDDAFKFYWIVILFLVLSIAQFLLLCFGIFAGRYKSRILLQIYLVFLAMVIAGLLLAGVTCLNAVVYLELEWNPSDATVDEIACRNKLVGCSDCDSLDLEVTDKTVTLRRCPEWTVADVLTLMSLEIRLVAVCCFLFSLYHVGAFIVTYLVQDNLKNYKSDFV